MFLGVIMITTRRPLPRAVSPVPSSPVRSSLPIPLPHNAHTASEALFQVLESIGSHGMRRVELDFLGSPERAKLIIT